MRSITTRFLLPLSVLAVAFAAFDLHQGYSNTQKHVSDIVNQQAALALEFDLAIRAYVAEHIRPRVQETTEPNEFTPETMSTSFVARSIFEKVRDEFPDYIIKCSSDNPRNPANQAGPAELRIVKYFNDNPQTDRWSGTIDLNGKEYLGHFRARRMKEECLRCHGEPEDAPASLLERYGATAGFHRPVGKVIALDTIAIPRDRLDAALASEVTRRSVTMVAELVLLFGTIALLFRTLVARRLARIADHFERFAAQPEGASITPVEVCGRDEIGVLAASFNTLAEKVRDAYVSLEQRVVRRTMELAMVNKGLQREIADRKQAEEALRESEEFSSSLLSNSPNPMIVINPDTSVEYVNPALEQLTGFSSGELIGVKAPYPWWTEETLGKTGGDLRQAMEKGAKRLEELFQKKNGERFWVQITSRPIKSNGVLKYYLANWTDTTEARRAEEALRESEKHHRDIFESATDGIIIFDLEGKITEANPAACAMYGYEHDELIGLTGKDIVHPAYYHLFENFKAQLKAEGRFYAESVDVRKDGTTFDIEVRGASVAFESKPHLLAVVSDITERKRAEAALQQAKEAAEAATRSKSEFLANMSHEIRTPMTAILGFSEKLLNRELPESDKLDAIQTIRRNGDYLLQIINDILDLSKIEAGKLEAERISCSPIRVVSDVQSLMQVRANEKGLCFTVEYDGPVPEAIQSDPMRLKQVLINLIGNAIKFTRTGGVRLVTRFVAAEETQGFEDSSVPGKEGGDGASAVALERPDPPVLEPHLQFDVIDTGIGLSKGQMDELFQPFVQGDASTTRRFGGSGLGLAICSRLANMLGGEITVESKLGEGSMFRVTIATGPLDGVKMIDRPTEAATAKRGDQATGTTSPPRLDGSILLAEDGPDNQRLISYVLRTAGADVTVAENGQIAVDKALGSLLARRNGDVQRPFDVILMDMQMPVLDGYGAASLLREKGYSGPIIAVTAHAMAGDREKCLAAGCDDYVRKPIDHKELVKIIHRHLQNGPRKMTDSGSETNALVSELADDPDMMKIVETFVDELPDRMAAIKQALADEDVETLGMLAHRLKGSGGGYGFPAITEAAGELEATARTDRNIKTLTAQVKELASLCERARATSPAGERDG